MTDTADAKGISCPFMSPAHFLEVENEGSTASGSQASTLSLKKKVNIANELKGFRKRDNEDSDLDVEQIQETTALNQTEGVILTSTEENYFTLSGTIKRGKKAGQNVDVKVNISREEFERLESTKAKLVSTSYQEPSQRQNKVFYQCGITKGLHILMWTFICFPFVFIASSIYSFYIGTFCWYNVFSWYTEEKAFICRILMPPFLIVCYPFVIILTSFGLGLYAAFEQISWNWYLWRGRVVDLEKGFYAYLCALIHLEECSPYTEIVIVDELVAS